MSKPGFIDYLVSEPATAKWQFYSVVHTGGPFNAAAISDLAGTVRTFLRSYILEDCDAVAFIAHSLGGLACRQAILEEIDRTRRRELKIFGLLMFGTPNDGTGVARAAHRLLGGSATLEMKTYSQKFKELNEAWLDRVANGGNPARAVDERAPLVCWNVVGTKDRVVPIASAQHLALLGNVYPLPYGHSRLVKPSSATDGPVRVASQFLTAVESHYRERFRMLGADELASEVRQRVQRAPWVRTEREEILLTPLSGSEEVILPEHVTIYRSTVTTRRTSVKCGDEIRIGFRLDSAAYADDVAVYSDFSVGGGVMGNFVDQQMRSAAADRRLEMFKVNYVQVRHDGRQLTFDQQPVLDGAGFLVFRFRCADFPADVERVDEVEIQVASYIDLEMGWYTYVCPTMVTDRLELAFRSPFEASCLLPSPLSDRFEATEHVINGMPSSDVSLPTTIAPGTRVTWVFRRT